MKLQLYYLTGTGNSLSLTRELAREFTHADVYAIPELLQNGERIRIEGDVVGFVFPVYFARPPVVVQQFIQEAHFGPTSYVFAAMNGGGLFGTALRQFDALLKAKGTALDAGFCIRMPGNHPKLAGMQRKLPEQLYAAASDRIREISTIIKTRQKHRVETNWGLFGRFLSRFAFTKPYKLSQAGMLDSAFHVSDACTGCGTCARVCPVGNISLDAGHPVWQHRCINCAACYHHCPNKALLLGNEDPAFRYLKPVPPAAFCPSAWL